ncbi:HAMP domain-containing sensor histidine kinase [Motilibacter peucedani]|uniref:HAMP domain-containing sensor histidine kinase n=1 Tax=Motilibacter peucedani TaxID=598650 RepID=UPI0011C40222|nr:HAMP domain-containing sensor histidine kinase [Motilibacter peucedani]
MPATRPQEAPARAPRPYGRGSLRLRVATAVALAVLVVCAVFASAAYLLARGVLTQQRESASLRQAYLDASFLRDELGTTGTSPAEALDALDPQGAAAVFVHRSGAWYSSSFDLDADAIPRALLEVEGRQRVAHMPTSVGGDLSLVIAVPVPAVGITVYEVVPLQELRTTLRVLSTVLAGGALAAAVLGALLGLWLGRRALRPLAPLTSTAAGITAGDLGLRLPESGDPALSGIVSAFNAMIETLQRRAERDARFAADVSHELRSPLTTLTASIERLQARHHESPERRAEALALATGELARFHRLLEGLLELARADAGPQDAVINGQPTDLGDLLRHVLRDTGRSLELLHAPAGGLPVRGDKLALARMVTNLLDNADRHGGGARAVRLERSAGTITLLVDDAGPGVADSERQRIFERFATGSGGRGSSAGTGLGLALVAETVRAHGGRVGCEAAPGGGARFRTTLPAADS